MKFKKFLSFCLIAGCVVGAGASYGGTRNMAFRAGITFGW